MKLGIFTAYRNFHKYYVRSCEELGVDYEIIDIIGPNWLEEVRNSDCDGFLCRPPSKFQERKSLFDERLYIVKNWLNKPIYPSFDELFIYENKRMMAYWLELNGFPHAKTRVFYRKEDFLDYLNSKSNPKFPFVFKTNIGTASKGVSIVKSKLKARLIANSVFGFKNTKLTVGYTPESTGFIKFPALGALQKHYILIQDYHKIKWEWRMVKINDSYFGHKKLKKGEFASGTRLKGWDNPPEELLRLTKDICEKGNFYSMDIDIFETEDGEFLVNELQSIFGQSTDSLMYIDGKPGRYIYKDNKFIFEEGEFNQHESFLLRTKHFIELLNGDSFHSKLSST